MRFIILFNLNNDNAIKAFRYFIFNAYNFFIFFIYNEYLFFKEIILNFLIRCVMRRFNSNGFRFELVSRQVFRTI